MCCGRGIKSAATQQYASQPSKGGVMKNKLVDVEVPERPKHAWEQTAVNEKYPTPQKVGAYYGNPVETKPKKAVAKEKVKTQKASNGPSIMTSIKSAKKDLEVLRRKAQKKAVVDLLP